MKTKLLITYLSLLILPACNYSLNNKLPNSPVITPEENSKALSNSCISDNLLSCIKDYLPILGNHNMPFEFITSVYFFNKDSCNYFTIWSFTSLPNHYIEFDNQNLKFIYCVNIVLNHTIVFISDENFKTNLYNCVSTNNIDPSYDPSNQIIYDGSWFPKTYTYYTDNDNIIINPIDTIICPILGKDFLEFEEYQRKINKTK